jgi:uncharacterized pyridoxal phosphate-containing UPF0001 family protein
MTKGYGDEVIVEALRAGITHVGENYLAELDGKRARCADHSLQWHYVGALQSNKIARIAAVADVVGGVSRLKEIERLAAVAPQAVIDVQVDTTGMEQRNGAAPNTVGELVAAARSLGLRVRGLMTVAPADPEGAREAFMTVRALADQMGVSERSMGMSEDFALALACGTTELRLGRLLFGSRSGSQPLPYH